MTFTASYVASRTPLFDTVQETPVSTSVLLDILSMRRVAGSRIEKHMIAKYIQPLSPTFDHYGNAFVTVCKPQRSGFTADESPTVAFTAHTDTVHSSTNTGDRQKLRLTHNGRMVKLDDPLKGDCLGADDGVGIWIMLNLIKAGVPGLYCFYRDEESGRLGSEWSAKHEPERYAGLQMMLSFDRRGTTDIITHQMGERCCSDAFAEALGLAIDPSGEVMGDDGGSFTDSYSFIHMVPECTNVCVGYYSQHTVAECQDITWAATLVNQLIAIDWDDLPVERDPSVDEFEGVYTMHDVVLAMPDDVATILEGYMGLTADDMIEALADYNMVSRTRIADAIDLELALQDTPQYATTDDFWRETA